MPSSSNNSSQHRHHRHGKHSSSHHQSPPHLASSSKASPQQYATGSTTYPSTSGQYVSTAYHTSYQQVPDQHAKAAYPQQQQYTTGSTTYPSTTGQYASTQYQSYPRASHQNVASEMQVATSTMTGHQQYQSPGTRTTHVWNEADRNSMRSVSRISRTDTVLSERIVEHEIKVPKRIIREDVVEKVVVVPEKVVREAVVEETVKVREKIIEVAKPVTHEKIVEVPQYEYVEKIVEVPERVVREKVREVPVTKYEEKIVQVPKIYTQERIVEVPEIEYRDVPVEKIVEVPEVREQVVVKEVPVPQYIDVPTPQYVNVEVPNQYNQKVPVPVEAVSTFAFKIPKLQPKYSSVDMTLYVPRFIEVPVPAEFMENASRQQAEQFASQVNILAQQKGASLCEVENLAGAIKTADFSGVVSSSSNFTSALTSAWREGRMQIVSEGGAHRLSNTRIKQPINVC